MPDYIYLLENRLSADQRNALSQMREATHEAGMLLFLTGDAVRDLTSGHAVRDLEVAVHGNALKLKKTVEKLGGVVWGEDEVSRTLYLCFPGTVRLDVTSTHRAEYPKPGKPVFHAASIQEDLRRRDFYGERHGHLAKRGIVRPVDGPDERGRGYRSADAAARLKLWIYRGPRASDSRHPATRRG